MIKIEVEKEIGTDKFVLNIRVTEVTTSLPHEVFVWQNQGDGTMCFSHVASVNDISSFDVEGTIGSTYLRRDILVQEFESTLILEECLESYKSAISELEIDFINSTEELGFGEPFEVILNEDIE